MTGPIGWLLASGLFFMPRRNVDITFRLVDRKELPPLEREKINPWFEAWYNEPSKETATFVPYHPFLGPREFEYPELAELKEVDLDRVSVKFKTAENVGPVGEGRSAESQAIVTLLTPGS